MIEELTPALVAVSLLIIAGIVPALTVSLSALMLWRYRRAVARNMALTGGYDGRPAPPQPGAAASGADRAAGGEQLMRAALVSMRRATLARVLAGLAFAIVFATAAQFVFPLRLGVAGFLLGVWIYFWPAILARLLLVPASPGVRVGWVLAYGIACVPLLMWAGTIADLAPMHFGAFELPARPSATPRTVMATWMVASGIPSVLTLLCFNRWVRAVAPLVLALVSTAVAGALAAVFGLFSPPGVDAAVALSTWLEVHPGWLILTVALGSLAGFGALGWALARWVGGSYRRKACSELGLLTDAMILVFAVWYAMWLTFGGLQWAATAPVALVAGKLAQATVRRRPPRPASAPACGLTFLRVFSLGRRSERLLDAVAAYWRHVGSVQMITGPDLARGLVQPHQFLDFLAGRLGAHFVRDADSLTRALAGVDRSPDPDGRFRINSFFCHADSWQAVLPKILERGDVVLMDLRSYAASNAGCTHELCELVRYVPLQRLVLVTDPTTDEAFLHETLRATWAALPQSSPNRAHAPEELRLLHQSSRRADPRVVIRRLCEAAGAA
jgi:hypothetical protein